MVLVIDAYNVLRQVSKIPHITESRRARFIQHAGRYGRRKGISVIIVFDGGNVQWPYRSYQHGVCVIYVGSKISADDYIREYIYENQAVKDMLIVTSDRYICSFAHEHGIASIDANAFYAMMEQVVNKKMGRTPKQPLVLVKTASMTTPCVDAIMTEDTKPVPEKKEDNAAITNRKSSAHKLSKAERALMTKIKKLS